MKEGQGSVERRYEGGEGGIRRERKKEREGRRMKAGRGREKDMVVPHTHT